MTVAVLFLVSLAFAPLIGLVPGFATTPALILVGAMMMADVGKINWQDYTVALPAFLTILMMPMTSSIANGFAFGFVSYAVLKTCAGKHKDVTPTAVTKPGASFQDIQGTSCQTAVEALAARDIINGMTADSYDPDATMTRAQYAAIIVRALGLKPDSSFSAGFTDVPADSWFASYVGTASHYGIVEGRGSGIFDPHGTINRQEAAVMTARAAALCGLDTSLTADGIRQYIAQFTDYVQVSKWARESMAFCFKAGILVSDEFEENIEPTEAICRSEVALMVYRLLVKAALI